MKASCFSVSILSDLRNRTSRFQSCASANMKFATVHIRADLTYQNCIYALHHERFRADRGAVAGGAAVSEKGGWLRMTTPFGRFQARRGASSSLQRMALAPACGSEKRKESDYEKLAIPCPARDYLGRRGHFHMVDYSALAGPVIARARQRATADRCRAREYSFRRAGRCRYSRGPRGRGSENRKVDPMEHGLRQGRVGLWLGSLSLVTTRFRRRRRPRLHLWHRSRREP